MPLPMQGNKLLPGHQNIVWRGVRPGPPDRGRGDRGGDTVGHLDKAAAGQFRAELGGIQRRALGGDGDQRRFQALGIDMAKFEVTEFLEVVVEQPGMVERGLENEGLAGGYGDAVAAMYRARRELLAGDHIRRRPAARARTAENPAPEG